MNQSLEKLLQTNARTKLNYKNIWESRSSSKVFKTGRVLVNAHDSMLNKAYVESTHYYIMMQDKSSYFVIALMTTSPYVLLWY